MEHNTARKFDKWDKVVRLNLLETGTEAEQEEVYTLLKDPSIYSYAFFRQADGSPFKAYCYQDIILNDPTKRIIFAASNQIGKSVTLCIKALHFAINHPGKTVIMVSKTLMQCKDLLRQIKLFLKYGVLDYEYDIGDTATKTEIYFKHLEEIEGADKKNMKYRDLPQSRIICVPATEAALGYPVDLLLIDELAFYDNGDHFYKHIAQPRTYTTKGQIIVFSNPNGMQGIFWELWNDDSFAKYNFNFLDCPGNTQEQLDKYIAGGLTQEQIDSTLLGKFTSPEGGFLTVSERKQMQEDRLNMLPVVLATPIFIFFDFAKTHDRTVRVIGCPFEELKGEGVFVHEMKEYPQNKPYNEIIDELEALIKQVGFSNVAMVGWDNTGVGAGIEDFIKRIEDMGVMCNPVSFSTENKSRIYTLLKLLIERNMRGEKGIKIPFISECDKQFSMLRFKRSSRGYLMVHHENESDRDDFPDALAGLCSLIVQPENPPVTCTIV